jgi:hypothetical protein
MTKECVGLSHGFFIVGGGLNNGVFEIEVWVLERDKCVNTVTGRVEDCVVGVHVISVVPAAGIRKVEKVSVVVLADFEIVGDIVSVVVVVVIIVVFIVVFIGRMMVSFSRIGVIKLWWLLFFLRHTSHFAYSD